MVADEVFEALRAVHTHTHKRALMWKCNEVTKAALCEGVKMTGLSQIETTHRQR